MEILSDTIFKGGMQAQSITVGNVNITKESVVVPSLYANQLLLCNGSQSISNFSDISNYVSAGSSSSNGKFESICACNLSITSCVSIKDKATITNYSGYGYSLVVNGTEYINGDLCVYGRTHLTDNLTVDGCVEINRSAYFNDYIWLNGESINRWSDLSQYIGGGCGSGSSSSDLSQYLYYCQGYDELVLCSSTVCSLNINYSKIKFTEFEYPAGLGHFTVGANGKHVACFYLPTAGYFNSSYSSSTPNYTSTSYVPKDNELVTAGWVRNNIGGGSGGSGSSNLPLDVICGTIVTGLKHSGEADERLPFRFLQFCNSGSNSNSYNIYSHCGFRTPYGIQIGYCHDGSETFPTGYINFNGEKIYCWAGLSKYISTVGSGSSGSSVYQASINDGSKFIIPGECGTFLLHTIDGVSPDKVGPIEIRGICSDDSGSYYQIKDPSTVFTPCSSLNDFHFSLRECSSENSTKVFGHRNNTYSNSVEVDPLILVTTIQN